ncbi:hypothetical protein B5K11_11715 [Rhizobium leguminosarum bv. trifolii]|uniref:helix-turn-helix transcriptional regulator n=1 Tax=Rhizobium leguminosarum TaxID=384 RepID=UPI000E2E6982|nr:AlpA family phage regulatory protein [Rhizobium leguminosarum]RFB95570.1 hypothetical protein B5K11_11715 [Rhizobium leguminosarum bv. trifolii]
MSVVRSNLIRAPEVRARFGGISDPTLYRWVKQAVIPQPIKIGHDRLWDDRELDEHVEALKRARTA